MRQGEVGTHLSISTYKGDSCKELRCCSQRPWQSNPKNSLLLVHPGGSLQSALLQCMQIHHIRLRIAARFERPGRFTLIAISAVGILPFPLLPLVMPRFPRTEDSSQSRASRPNRHTHSSMKWAYFWQSATLCLPICMLAEYCQVRVIMMNLVVLRRIDRSIVKP